MERNEGKVPVESIVLRPTLSIENICVYNYNNDIVLTQERINSRFAIRPEVH